MMVNNNHDFMDRMCPNELQMKIVVNWLGLKLYDRRNDTSFPIVIIPFLCSNTCLRSLNIIMRYFSVFDVFSMFVHVDYFLLLPSVYLSILIYDFFFIMDWYLLSFYEATTNPYPSLVFVSRWTFPRFIAYTILMFSSKWYLNVILSPR